MYKYKELKKLDNWGYIPSDKVKIIPDIDAYVDGSYTRQTGKGGCGVYIIKKETEEVIYKEFKDLGSKEIKIKNKSSLSSELNAVLRAIDVAKSLGLKQINIVYDCHAVLSSIWDTKVKNDIMYEFRKIISDYLKDIYITFTHAQYYNHHIHNNAHRLSRSYIN